MKRYIFLMLAFFLTFSSHGQGLGFSTSMMGVHAAPQGLSEHDRNAIKAGQKKNKKRLAYINPSALKETSPRNVDELGNISESGRRAGENSASTQADGQNTGVPNLARKKGKTALSNVSCKTYEGKIFNKGDAGYSDCIRTIRTDRQSEKAVP